MKSLIAFIIIIIYCQPLKAQIIDSTYTLATPAGKIVGTLHTPEDAKYDMVIVVPGSGPTNRDGNNPMGLKPNAYKMMSDSLAKYGISSLRYDKKGIGESISSH